MASLSAKPMMPQIQKKHAKGTLLSCGTKSGRAAPAVPRARKRADSPSRKAWALLLKPSNFSPTIEIGFLWK